MKSRRINIFAFPALVCFVIVNGCVFDRDEGFKKHRIVGAWEMRASDSGKVFTTQYEFLPNGKLRGFVEYGRDSGGAYVSISRDTMGDSSRYEVDAVSPGVMHIFQDVGFSGGRCDCLLERWSRYEISSDSLRLYNLAALHGMSPSLIGTWSVDFYEKDSSGHGRQTVKTFQFGANDTVVIRTVHPQSVPPDSSALAGPYVDSGKFFMFAPGDSTRFYYRIESGYLLYDTSDSLYVAFRRVE